MKLQDLVKLLGELLYILAAIALGHILIVKVLMGGGDVAIGPVIAILIGLLASKIHCKSLCCGSCCKVL